MLTPWRALTLLRKFADTLTEKDPERELNNGQTFYKRFVIYCCCGRTIAAIDAPQVKLALECQL